MIVKIMRCRSRRKVKLVPVSIIPVYFLLGRKRGKTWREEGCCPFFSDRLVTASKPKDRTHSSNAVVKVRQQRRWTEGRFFSINQISRIFITLASHGENNMGGLRACQKASFLFIWPQSIMPPPSPPYTGRKRNLNFLQKSTQYRIFWISVGLIGAMNVYRAHCWEPF